MAGLGFRGLNERPIENPGAFLSNGAQPGRLIEVPGASYEVIDALTTVPVSVTVGKFLISPTQLTQQELEEIMAYNPSFHRGPDLPVENLTWWEPIRYCNLRSIRENLEPCFNLATGSGDLRKNEYRRPKPIRVP